MRIQEIAGKPTDEVDELLAEFPHGIVVLDENNHVLHVCTYPKEPTTVDYEALLEELKTDESLGLIGVDLTKLAFCKATGHLLEASIRSLG